VHFFVLLGDLEWVVMRFLGNHEILIRLNLYEIFVGGNFVDESFVGLFLWVKKCEEFWIFMIFFRKKVSKIPFLQLLMSISQKKRWKSSFFTSRVSEAYFARLYFKKFSLPHLTPNFSLYVKNSFWSLFT
jgi:hypothetical protein